MICNAQPTTTVISGRKTQTGKGRPEKGPTQRQEKGSNTQEKGTDTDGKGEIGKGTNTKRQEKGSNTDRKRGVTQTETGKRDKHRRERGDWKRD